MHALVADVGAARDGDRVLAEDSWIEDYRTAVDR